MHVHCTRVVPARVDGEELDFALVVCRLGAPQEPLRPGRLAMSAESPPEPGARTTLAPWWPGGSSRRSTRPSAPRASPASRRDVGVDIRVAAVVAESVAGPDLGPDSGNRLASTSVDDLHPEDQVNSRSAPSHIPSVVHILDVVGPVDLPRGQYALGSAGKAWRDDKRAEGGTPGRECLPTGRLNQSFALVQHSVTPLVLSVPSFHSLACFHFFRRATEQIVPTAARVPRTHPPTSPEPSPQLRARGC